LRYVCFGGSAGRCFGRSRNVLGNTLPFPGFGFNLTFLSPLPAVAAARAAAFARAFFLPFFPPFSAGAEAAEDLVEPVNVTFFFNAAGVDEEGSPSASSPDESEARKGGGAAGIGVGIKEIVGGPAPVRRFFRA